MKKALITGITGQDGSYLADLLLEKGYEVHGIIRRASTFNTARIDHLYADPHINGVRMFLHYGDLSDSVNLVKLLYELKPDEIYHLGAQSHVRVSFDIPEYTSDVTAVGTIRILEAIREAGLRSRFYQASSSEMFGKAQQVPHTEKTPFWPRSPYGVAKVFAYWATAMASCSTTKARAAGKLSSLARSRVPSPRSNADCKRNCSSVTWTRNAIGDMHRSTSKACGEFFSLEKGTISCWLLVKRTPCVSLPKRLFHMSILIGKNSSNTTHVMSGQQKLSTWSVTLPKPKRFSIGNRRYDSTSLSASWLTRTWNCFRTELRENISANCRRVGTARRAVRTSQRDVPTELQTAPDLFRPSSWPRRGWE